MSKKNPEMKLATLEDLFTTQETRDEAGREKVVDLSLDSIDDFPKHPFQINMDDDSMKALVDSVRTIGIQTPAIVNRKDGGRYEMVSGHRRKEACLQIGLSTIPCIVREMSQDEATIFMVSSNVQRTTVLHSEKANACKMMLESIKRQGERTDLTSPQLVEKLKGKEASDIVGEAFGISREQIRRLIRLLDLIDYFLEMVDKKRLSFTPAVEISHLPPKAQHDLCSLMERDKCTPSLSQARELRKRAEEGDLDADAINAVMRGDKPKPMPQIKIPTERITRFFPAKTKANEIEDTIVKALEFFCTHQPNQGE